jgi:hypothetical protein
MADVIRMWSPPSTPAVGPFAKATGIVLLATGLFAAWIGLGVGGDTSVLYVDDLGTVIAALAATVFCVRAGARHVERLRRFWLLRAGACAAWTLGEAIWAVYDLILREPIPAPSWADVGYLTGIPLAVAALVCHPAMRAGMARRARSMLDALILATALLFLSWTVVLGPLWRGTDLTTLGGLTTIAYPFGDIVIVFFIVLAVRGMTGGGRLALWCLLAGLLAMALSDSGYTYLTTVKGYETGSVIDSGWFAAYLAIALGAFSANAGAMRQRSRSSSSPTLAALLAPIMPVLGALGFAAIRLQNGNRLDDVAWITVFALIVLVLVRHGLLLLDVAMSRKERGLYELRVNIHERR